MDAISISISNLIRPFIGRDFHVEDAFLKTHVLDKTINQTTPSLTFPRPHFPFGIYIVNQSPPRALSILPSSFPKILFEIPLAKSSVENSSGKNKIQFIYRTTGKRKKSPYPPLLPPPLPRTFRRLDKNISKRTLQPQKITFFDGIIV